MKRRINSSIKEQLDELVERFNRPDFIPNDPVSIPHMFSKRQDIEIAALFAAVLGWGQRITIINKCKLLMQLMDGTPHDFVLHHRSRDLKKLESFKHRTFNGTDLLYFVSFLRHHYQRHASLEELFVAGQPADTVESGLIQFHHTFFSLPDHPGRTRKHISTPERNSACKRLNMFLRWMVRKDNRGVDFGLWTKLKPRQLVCPCDVHVEKMARKFKLIKRRQVDWATALELTEKLKGFDPDDPVKYDFALFGLGVNTPERLRDADGH